MLSQDEYKEIYSKVPRLTVEVIVETPQGYVFSLRDIAPWKGFWHIPGGTVYYGENLIKAVKRIAKKEVGLEVIVKEFVGYLEYRDTKSFGGFDHPVGLVFLVKSKGGKLKNDFQSTEVRTFRKLPRHFIKEQRQFLVRRGLLNGII